jgi:pyruvate,water dikinase
MNVGNPNAAFQLQFLPNFGVGLARIEFIINSMIRLHPNLVLTYPNIPPHFKKRVEQIIRGYPDPKTFYIDKLSEGIATIAAAFWPKPVVVRLSDFKTDEYRELIGGNLYEPLEKNPMIGWRGASRYITPSFSECFAMECMALRNVREKMGLVNVELMIPFVRTVQECKKVIELLATHGLKRGENGLRLIMMCEIPSNALLAEQFLHFVDGYSIGSNDMTQLTLGIDRDSEILEASFDERDPATKALFKMAIETCKSANKSIGICGQAPSDYLDFAEWLVHEGISSLSLNPDTVIKTWIALAQKEISQKSLS